MKKITLCALICFINLATNPLAAMDDYKENIGRHSYNGPSGLGGGYEEFNRALCYVDAETIIKKAVEEAVGNDQGPITLDIRNFENCSGYCDSTGRIIGIHRCLALPENSDLLAWNAAHEAGHLQDKINQKINFYQSIWTIFGGLLPIAAQSRFCRLYRKPLNGITSIILSIFGSGASYLAFKHLGGRLYCTRQGELRADKSAMERLLEKKKYTAVTCALKDKLTGITLGLERCDISHPTLQKECKNIVKTIRKQGYDVQLIHDQEQITKLRKMNYWRFTPLTILCLLKNNQPVAYDASELKLAEFKS